jgi:hypothetical protein
MLPFMFIFVHYIWSEFQEGGLCENAPIWWIQMIFSINLFKK